MFRPSWQVFISNLNHSRICRISESPEDEPAHPFGHYYMAYPATLLGRHSLLRNFALRGIDHIPWIEFMMMITKVDKIPYSNTKWRLGSLVAVAFPMSTVAGHYLSINFHCMHSAVNARAHVSILAVPAQCFAKPAKSDTDEQAIDRSSVGRRHRLSLSPTGRYRITS